jgi:hypothetical protein
MADDSTQYAIDVAAQMTGAESSISQLAALADKLSGAGVAATSFDAALASTSSKLAEAAQASSAAASALAEGETKYAELERAAVRAAVAVERAGLQMSGSVPADLAQKARAAEAALRAEAITLDDLRAKAAGAAGAQGRLADTMKRLEAGARAQTKLAKSGANAGETFEKLGGVLARLGGPLGSMGSQAAGGAGSVAKLASALGGVAAAGVAAVAIVGLVVVGIGAAIVKTTAWAIGLADAARSAGLQTAALEQTSESLSGLGALLPSLQNATGQSRDELEGLAKSLAGAKVAAADMPAALRAAATAEAALGKGGAAKFIADLEEGKLSVDAFAAEVEQKFGGIVAAKLLGLDAQTARFNRNLTETFGGLDIDPMLAALTRLVELFDQNTEMGKLLKDVFEGVFQPFVDGAEKAFYMVEAFALGVAITGLKVYIAFKPLIRAVEELFGGTDSALPDALDVALFLGKHLTGIFIGMAAVVAALAAPLIAAALGFAALVGAAGTAWDAIKASAQQSVDWLKSIDLAQIGADLIGGLASGITAGAKRVIDAITGVVGGAITAAKNLLGISSDSKVFAQIAGHTVGGMEHGLERGAPRVRSAMEAVVEPPGASSPAGALLAARAGGNTYNIVINAGSESSAQSIAQEVKRVLLEITEGDLLQLGAGEMAAA